MKKSMLNPWRIAGVMATVGLLAACDPPPTTTLVIPMPEQVPIAPPVTTAPVEAVHGLSGDAALVAQSAINADSTPNPDSLSGLQVYVGTYPSDGAINYLEQGVLAERLKQLLGDEYANFLLNMGVASPLTQDGMVWFITGNRPHEGGMQEAAVVIDSTQDAVRVWMLSEGQPHEWLAPSQANVPWPKDVQTMLDNQKNKQ